MRHTNIVLVVACVLGLVVPIMARLLMGAFASWNSILSYITVLFVVSIFSWLVASWSQLKPKRAVVLLYLMIPIGVILDVIVDGSLNKVDRNLFPFEILIWLILAPLPIWIGYLLRIKRNA